MMNIIKSFKDLPPQLLTALAHDPAFFIWFAFDEWLWSLQRTILFALKKYRRVAVYACHAVGKSHLASRIVPWFLQTHKNSIVIVTAPRFEQAKNNIWRRVVEAYAKSRIKLAGKPTSTEWNVYLGKNTSAKLAWYAKVETSSKEDGFQGIHAPYLLFIFDEASGIPDFVWNATEGNLASGEGYWLAIGNPLRPEGRFYQTLFDPRFVKIRISAFDTPLFTGELETIPEKYRPILESTLISPEFVEQVKRVYGENSAMYKVKVLGEFPITQSASSLFPEHLIEYAFNNENAPKDIGGNVVTIDPAGFGEDHTIITVWQGLYQVDLIRIPANTLGQIASKVERIVRDYNIDAVIFDRTGLGEGLGDLLLHLPTEVFGVHFSQKARKASQFADTRTEMYFNLAKALRDKQVRLYPDPKLKEELLAMEVSIDTKGRYKLEPKKNIRAKLGRSPDSADAVALRFAMVNFLDDISDSFSPDLDF